MTTQEVREKLPIVTVCPYFGVFLQGRTTGRNNDFATVTADHYGSRQFSWEAVARAVTNGSALLF